MCDFKSLQDVVRYEHRWNTRSEFTKRTGHSGNCKHPGTSSSLPAGKTSSKEVGLLIKNNWDAYKHTQSRWVSVQRNVVTQRQLFCLSCSLSTPLSSSLFPLARPSTSFSPPLPSLLFHVTTAVSQSVQPKHSFCSCTVPLRQHFIDSLTLTHFQGWTDCKSTSYLNKNFCTI